MIRLLSIILLCCHIPTGRSFYTSCSAHYRTAQKKPTAIVATWMLPGQQEERIVGDDEDDVFELDHSNSRRRWIQHTILVAGLALGPRTSFAATDVLPEAFRDYTKLAPLGPKESTTIPKSTNLSPEEIAQRLTNDLMYGATNRGGYFLTGDLSRDLFRDDCVFEDPTNRVDSLNQYQTALTLLFDPENSSVELLDDGLKVVRERCLNSDDQCTTTIRGRLRSRGYLKVAPWRPYVKAYETNIVWTLDPKTGLIARQDQTWSKGASEALRETFTPTVSMPPKSTIPKPDQEPKAVTQLFERLNGRRPNEYSNEERGEIDGLLDRVAILQPNASSATSLAGTWVLVYLQEGPDGAGIDRRIPFPEVDFNNNFQVFFSSSSNDNSADRVTNIGQVLGSLADVRVSGTLQEIASVETNSKPKRRFEANIQGGKICFNTSLPSQQANGKPNCPIDLPMIQGKGIFDSIYLGDRLRIGQNINGGGARVVQIRIA